MNCGCNTCDDCGDTPKVSGTEVTILSGTKPARQNGFGDGSNKGFYYVTGGAAVIALIAFFVTRK